MKTGQFGGCWRDLGTTQSSYGLIAAEVKDLDAGVDAVLADDGLSVQFTKLWHNAIPTVGDRPPRTCYGGQPQIEQRTSG
jgi:hypothetical protein